MNAMNGDMQEKVEILCNEWLKRNYDMVWLKTMLEKGKGMRKGGTLITGSSHALNGIDERYIPNCVNCSMHTQDIYYDYLCAKETIENGNKNAFDKCIIIMGYYIAFQDLSRSTNMRKQLISPIYYPIFGDAHNWEKPNGKDLWKEFTNMPEEWKEYCERYAMNKVMQRGTYYSDLRRRKPFFDFKGKEWHELFREEQDFFAKERTNSHNKLIIHTESYVENCDIMKDYVHLLHMNNIQPIVAITPYTASYNKYIDLNYKEAILDMLNNLKEDVHFVDFNDSDLFDDYDFIDTDHLNSRGAQKVSCWLDDLF